VTTNHMRSLRLRFIFLALFAYETLYVVTKP